MNIVYLIGNGFDVNLQLPTRYQEFYDYYVKQPNANDDIKALKEDIVKDPKNWSDLELGLGAYTRELDSVDKLSNLHRDFVHGLSKYLIEIEEGYECDESRKAELFKHLIFPENQFFKTDSDKIKSYKNNWENTNPWHVRIITFNYTTILEKLLDFSNKPILLGNSSGGRTIYILKISNIYTEA